MSKYAKDSYCVDASEVLRHYHVDERKGLSLQQIDAATHLFGKNEIPPPPGASLLKLILEQFEDLLVLILLAAAVVSFILALFEDSGDDRWTAFVEPAVILIILVANAAVGVFQETNAAKAIEKLKQSEAREANVLRDGHTKTIHSIDVVPGDIIIVSEGDKVPADCRIISLSSATLSVDESMLTGESEAANKHAGVINKPNAVNQDKRNVLFSGTLIVKGKAQGVVVAIGAQTEMGAIAHALGSETETKTPLQQRLDEFGSQLSKVIGVICVVVWLINIGHFTDPDHGSVWRGAIYYFKIAVALAVAAIPEGLPAVVTTCLALGTMKMARKNAIVRSLPSVETLGCTTVICSDKTGTLTTNMMSVVRVLTVEQVEHQRLSTREFIVEGDSWSPIGAVIQHTQSGGNGASNGAGAAASSVATAFDAVTSGSATGRHNKSFSSLSTPHLSETHTGRRVTAVDDACLSVLGKISALCNEATLGYKAADAATNTAGAFVKTGAPTEAALLVLAEKVGVPDARANDDNSRLTQPDERAQAASRYWNALWAKEYVLEFDRDRKSMSVVCREASGAQRWLFCKGAPESVLERCSHVRDEQGSVQPLTAGMLSELSRKMESYAMEGLRCLALAEVQLQHSRVGEEDFKDSTRYRQLESGMTFVGLAMMMDPPRQQVNSSILKCRTAGIRVIVITGDNQVTAEAICRRIGVFGADEATAGKSFTGAEWEQMSEKDKQKAVKHASLFSRVEPKHKLQIVRLLQGHASSSKGAPTSAAEQRAGEVVAMTGDGVNDATALKEADIGIAMGSGTDVAREASKMVLQDDNFATIVMAVEEGRAIYSNTKQFIRYLISSNIGEVACIFLTAMIGMPEALIPVQLLWVNLVTDGLPATALGFNPPDNDIMLKPPRGRTESIINRWMFFRYVAVGLYVGIGTVSGFIWWFLYAPNGPHISWTQLTDFHACDTGGANFVELKARGYTCDVFHDPRPSTMSLSILVMIEMFNALNALSENQSLLTVTPLSNLYVLVACALSFLLHLAIVYVPFLASIFHVAPLDTNEWLHVLYLSLPIFLLDEALKAVSRLTSAAEMQERRRQINHELSHVVIMNTHNPNLIALASSPFDSAQAIATGGGSSAEETDALLLHAAAHSHKHPTALAPLATITVSPASPGLSPSVSRSTSPLPTPYRLLSSLVPQSISSLPWYQRLMRRSLTNHEQRLRAHRALSTGQPLSSSSSSPASSSSLSSQSPLFGSLSAGHAHSHGGHRERERDREQHQPVESGSEDDPALVTLLKKV